MKTKVLPVVLLFGIIAALGSVAAAKEAAPDVSEVWLDSLQANLWRMDMDSLGYEMSVTTTTERLSKNGEVKDVEVVYGKIATNEDGERVMRVYNDEGEIIDEKELKEDRPREEKPEEEEFDMNPFEAFGPEKRAGYQIKLVDYTPEGHAVLSLQPYDEGFAGEIVVDTTLWIPLKAVGVPNPMPKHVKEMHVKLVFSPDWQGANLMRKMETIVHAKYLLFNFNMRIHQVFSDYKLVGNI